MTGISVRTALRFLVTVAIAVFLMAIQRNMRENDYTLLCYYCRFNVDFHWLCWKVFFDLDNIFSS